MVSPNRGYWVGANVDLVFNKRGDKVKLIQNDKVVGELSTKSLVIKASATSDPSASTNMVLLYENVPKKPKKKTVEFTPEKDDDDYESAQSTECLRCGEYVAIDDVDCFGVCSYCAKMGDD